VNEAARFQYASDQSILVYLDDGITPRAHLRVVKFLRLLEREPVAGIRNLHPAYCSVLVKFDALSRTHQEMEAALRPYLDRIEHVDLPGPRLVEIPVRYGGEFGPDLNDVAALHDLTPAQVIELHASAIYTVYFLGFAPGFAYLGGLPEALATPRLPAPRKRVPRGSVGIAGNQAGVYPFETPGGWRLLGRTSVEMFRPDRAQMNLLSIGDHVKFTPVHESD
jgi:inhibitor of KinA